MGVDHHGLDTGHDELVVKARVKLSARRKLALILYLQWKSLNVRNKNHLIPVRTWLRTSPYKLIQPNFNWKLSFFRSSPAPVPNEFGIPGLKDEVGSSKRKVNFTFYHSSNEIVPAQV